LKPATGTIQHEGTLSGEKTRMFFDAQAAVHLMSVLTDLYEDPATAVIREISTNGHDSHVAAGNKDPIEVSLPNTMRQTFVVKDYGIGMSAEDVTQRYAAYGYSSKRETDEQTGMLGLGCKAPLTYTSQFTVVAVQNGRKTIVLITRDADGCGAVQVVSETDTLDPNGVEVQVPVSNVQVFNNKAEAFYQFWAPNTVKVNGKAPVSIFDPKHPYKPSLLDDDVALIGAQSYVLDADYVVMGNVPYKLSGQDPLGNVKKARYGRAVRTNYVVVRVPMGSVDFTPSREGLHYTKDTLETLSDVKGWIAGRQVIAAQTEVADAASKSEALEVALRWRNAGVNPPLTYKHEPVPVSFPTSGSVKWDGSTDNAARTVGAPSSVRIEVGMGTLHVLGFKGSRLDPTTKAKLVKWLQINNRTVNTGQGHGILCYNFQPYESWLPADRIVDIKEIRAIDLGKSAPVRKQAKYRVVSRYGTTTEYDNLDDITYTNLVVVDSVHRANDFLLRNIGETAYQNGDVAVLVAPSKRAAFFRKNKCIDWEAYVKRLARQALKGCRPNDVLAFNGVRRNEVNGLYGVKPEDVIDPEVKALLEDAQRTTTSWDPEPYRLLVKAFGARVNLPALPPPPKDDWKERTAAVLTAYPHLKVTQDERVYAPGETFGRTVPVISSAAKVEILNALYYARTSTPQTPDTTTNNQEQTK
jgi:hypothetical protein